MEGLEEKIDDGFRGLHDKIDGALKDHEDRLRTVEKVQSEQHGGWKVLAIIGGAAATVGSLIAAVWANMFGGG
jgi:hypothetical protein